MTKINEAPRANARGIFSAFGGAKSAEAENKHSSTVLRPWSSAKADKINGKNGVNGINKRSRGFASVRQILKGFDPIKDKYISREFQKFGYDLAVALGDLKHKSLYIKLAKELPRAVLEKALSFVKDSRARSKARLFMWKLKELREERGKRGEKGKKGKELVRN